ncbi:MAG: hypothetical protein WBD87_11085 [Candidatus Acidiferrales bacterium]
MKPPRFTYSAYGLQFISDRSLPGLVPLDAAAAKAPDLRIQLDEGEGVGGERDAAGETLWYTTDIRDTNGNPGLKIWKGRSEGDFFIRYIHGLTFRVDSTISCVRVHRLQPMSEEDIASFLLGPVLGIVLRLKGVTCLHASAVEIGGKAVAFAGVMGAGKSTTAAMFARNRHSVLTDDIVALEKRGPLFLVHPGYPFLNLLPDSMALLSGSAEALPLTEPAVEKRQMMLDGSELRFQGEALPLGVIYVLDERSREASATTVHPLSPQEALIALASNTYANKMLDVAMRAREFRELGELVRSVPIRRLVAPARSPDLASFYRTICKDAGAAMKSRTR